MATLDTPFRLTDAAVAKVKELLSAEDGDGQSLRVQVKGGGCSGFQYQLGFDDQQYDDDVLIEQDGVRCLVDVTSMEYLQGAYVDFQDGLNGKGFAIENPNSTGNCGCGQSFSC